MRFALMLEPQQGLTYDEQLAIARRVEAGGFQALFRSDHYESFPGPAGRPTTDAWTVLAGLARETDRINLGVLVSPVTFRTPGSLVKIVTTVDQMSGGRVEVGLGAGWHEVEHRRHGFPFPAIKVRADMLEETLEVIHGLWDEPDGWSFHGQHVVIDDALFAPKPVADRPDGRARPPILVGGEGSPRSFRLAARYADEFNVSSSGPERIAEVNAALDAACRDVGRDPATLSRSAMVGVLVGRTPAEVEERSRRLLAAFSIDEQAEEWFAERRKRWIFGTPDEARAMVARFEAAGAQRIMLQDFLPRDHDMIDLIAETLVRA